MDKKTLNQAVQATVQAFRDSFDEQWVSRAQVAKSSSRNAMFGIIMNEPFIESGKKVISLAEYFGEEDAKDICSLVIWSLANNSHGFVKPAITRIGA